MEGGNYSSWIMIEYKILAAQIYSGISREVAIIHAMLYINPYYLERFMFIKKKHILKAAGSPLLVKGSTFWYQLLYKPNLAVEFGYNLHFFMQRIVL